MAALELWGIDFKDTEPVFNENEETVTLAYFNPEKDLSLIIVFEKWPNQIYAGVIAG
jgi:hypothetical protein